MADNLKFVQAQPFFLSGSGVSLGATEITLQSFLGIDGTPLVMNDFGTIGYGTLEPNNFQREEQISFTGVVQNANGTAKLVGVKTVSFVDPYTQTSGVSKSHAGGAVFVISNTSGFYATFANKNNNETITQQWIFPSTEADRPNLSADVDAIANTALITHGELSRATFAGTVNASTVQKGISELSTLDEQDDGTSIGGTGAFLVPQNENMTENRMNIVRFIAGEAINATTPIAVYEKESDGRVYLTVRAYSESTFSFVGFVVAGQNVVAGDVVRVQVAGKVKGFVFLTIGIPYYISSVAPGRITSTVGSQNFQVGRSITANTLLIEIGQKIRTFTQTLNAGGTTTLTTGFRSTHIDIYAINASGQISIGGWTTNDNTGGMCMYSYAGGFGTDSGRSWYVTDGVTSHQGIISNVTTNSFDLNNTKVGAAPDVQLVIKAYGN